MTGAAGPPPRPLLAVAHRAGNTVAGVRTALDAGVDLVELDVHRYRGLLEVRHHKAAGPRHLWEAGSLVRRADLAVAELGAIVAEARGDPRLMIDLKGVPPGLAPAVAGLLRREMPGLGVTVCSRHWWMLDEFVPPVRRVLSVGSRVGLQRLRRRLCRTRVDGVCLRLDLATRALVRQLHERTDLVLTWPVDTPAALEAARGVGVDGVISKDLALLAAVIAAR